MSASALVEGYRSGRADPVVVIQDCLERCKADRNGAFLALDPEGARVAAEQARDRYAQGKALGPWDGVPFGAKDNLAAKALPWTNGMVAYRERVAEFDAQCLADLKASGAVLVGKCHLNEAALGTSSDNPWFGRCHNPRRAGISPGGSSGGSAAAVAAGLVPLALGTDTMGSVRIPAGCCGVYGYKPSPGRVPLHGLEVLSERLDTVGLLASNLTDLLEYGLSLAGLTEEVSCLQPESLRVGILEDSGLEGCHPEVVTAYRSAVSTLRGSGVPTVSVSWVEQPSRLRRAGLALCEVEAYARYGWLLDSHPEWVSSALVELLTYGRDFSPQGLREAEAQLTALTNRVQECWSGVDAVLTPVTPTPPHSFETPAPAAFADFTAPANLTRRPAVALPFSQTSEGLPLGLQLLGHQGHDVHLLSCTRTLVEVLALDDR